MKFRHAVVSAFFVTLVSAHFAYATDSVKNKPILTEISSKLAEEIALKLAPGKVIEVEHEKRSGVSVYVVEIQTVSGLREITMTTTDGKIISDSKKSKPDNHSNQEEIDK